MSDQDSPKKFLMDEKTARAFAGHRFLDLHPEATLPSWLSRCTVVSWNKAQGGQTFEVHFGITPKATLRAFNYFSVAVDRATAEMRVLKDQDLAALNGPDFAGYDAADLKS